MTAAKTWTLHVGRQLRRRRRRRMVSIPRSRTLFHNGVTAGCSAGNYCPGSSVTRAQMAVFLLKAKLGRAYLPPPATGNGFRRRPGRRLRRRLDRGSRRQRDRRRLRGRDLLPGQPGDAGADGGLPAEGETRQRLRAATGRGPLRRRAAFEPLRAVDRAARSARASPPAAAAGTTVPRAEHPRTDGGVFDQMFGLKLDGRFGQESKLR